MPYFVNTITAVCCLEMSPVGIVFHSTFSSGSYSLFFFLLLLLPVVVCLPVQGGVSCGWLEGVRPTGRVQASGSRHHHSPSPRRIQPFCLEFLLPTFPFHQSSSLSWFYSGSSECTMSTQSTQVKKKTLVDMIIYIVQMSNMKPFISQCCQTCFTAVFHLAHTLYYNNH